MRNVAQATWVELVKARRSKAPLLTAAGFMLLPLVGGFFMIILRDPEFARQVGLISAKAELMAGTADWPAYLDLLNQGIAIGGLIVFSFVGSWVFGREFSDNTAKYLLALPTSRSSIVAAKFVVIALWSFALVAMIVLVGLGVGYALSLPLGSTALMLDGSIRLAVTAAISIVSVTPIVFFASYGRGYLPPMGAAVLAIVLAQVIAVTGWGEYFPWSVPALYAQGAELGPISFVLVALTGVAGAVAAFVWWELADQTQ